MHTSFNKIAALLFITAVVLVFVSCKKEHDSPKDHLYIYSTKGVLKRRQYIHLKLSGDDTPKKKHETLTISSHGRDHIESDYGLTLYFPSGVQTTTYFDMAGKSSNNVTMSITSYHGYSGAWYPVSGQVNVHDHSTHLVPPFIAKGRISFSNLMCIDTSSAYSSDTIIITGDLKYE